MKRVRNLLAALILSLVLTSPAFAGDIMMGITSEQGNPPSNSTQQSSSNAATEADPSTASTAIDPVTEALLALINGIASIF
jgi:hypothetical protein